MNQTLDRIDLMNLLKGNGAPFNPTDEFLPFTEFCGDHWSPDWRWSLTALAKLSNDELWTLYTKVKRGVL